MSWKKQTNIPDYQKVLQHQYEPTGWSADDVYVPTRRADTFRSHTQSVESSRAEHSTYEPSKYGLVTDTHLESPNRFIDLTLEETVNIIKPDDLGHARHGDVPSKYSSQYVTTSPTISSDEPTWHRSETTISPIRDNFDESEQHYKTPAKRQNVVHRSKENRRSFPEFSHTDLKSYDSLKNSELGHIGYSASDLRSHTGYSSGEFRSHVGDSRSVDRKSPVMNYDMDSANQLTTIPIGSASSFDLKHWQQKHLHLLNQQKREIQGLGGTVDSQSQSSTVKFVESDPYNFDSLRKAADATIREKDLIITRLKSNLVQLNEDCHQYETKLRHALMSQSGQDTALFKQIQDLEYEKSSFKSALLSEKSKKNSEIEDLELKLGAAEHELKELKSALRNRSTDTHDLKQQFDSKENELAEWKSKFMELKNGNHELKEKLDGLQRYLSDLPTVEETAKNDKALAAFREERDADKIHIQQAEQKLHHARKLLMARELHIRELEKKEQELEEQVVTVTKEIKKIKSQDSEAVLHHAQEEVRQLTDLKIKMSDDLEKAKKFLEANHRKYRQTEVKHQNEVRHLQERLAQEEQSVDAFREDSRVKEEQMMKIKHSMKELGSQNQDLLEQNLILKEKLGQLEQQCSAENSKLQHHLMAELNACFLELQSLVQICMQKAEGQNPNMSALLGVRASLSSQDQSDVSFSPAEERQSLKYWLTKVQELKAEVEKLRVLICDKYAEDMGENMNCTTQ